MPKKPFLEMLRAKNIFGPPGGNGMPLGMPEIDNGNIAAMFRSVTPLAESLKNRDMQREKEMMEFRASLARKQMPQQTAPIGMIPPKKNVIYGGVEPNRMQEQFRQDTLVDKAHKRGLDTLGATQRGALNNALITGKQRSDAEMAQTMAEINGRENVARTNKEMAAKAADDARKDKDTEAARARLEKGQPMVMKDPRTGQDISVRFNPATAQYERIQIDGEQAGSTRRMGIDKVEANPGQDPVKLAAVRKSAQAALDELDQLVEPDGSLKTHTSDAVGKSRILPDLMDTAGLGSLTPSTTKGREGLKSLKGKLVIDLISQMKAQSKTGATGFGAMNKAELAILENSASKLSNRDLSDEDFRAELGRIRERLRMVMEDDPGTSGSGSGASDADRRADDYMRRKGLK